VNRPHLRISARVQAFLDHASAYFEAKRNLFAGRASATTAAG
jgi:hypothetical protein